jgi:hypothetical protein
MRLVACAFGRAIWAHLTGDPARQAIEVAEQVADGRAPDYQLAQASRRSTAPTATAAVMPNPREAAQEALRHALARLKSITDEGLSRRLVDQIADATTEAIRNAPPDLHPSALKSICKSIERRLWSETSALSDQAQLQDRSMMASLVRDLLGNPFRPAQLQPAWLAADGERVRAIAESIYDEGRFQDTVVLGDALEEAGCDEPIFLQHARQKTSHYRGCWLLDAILGKE